MVRNFYIPTKVTDYATHWEKGINRVLKQIEEDYQNKVAHSKQVQKADKDVTNLALLDASLKFLGKGDEFASLKSSIVGTKEERQTKTDNRLNFYTRSADDKDAVKSFIRWNEGDEEIRKDHKNFKSFLNTEYGNGKINKELYDILEKASGGETLRIKKWQINQSVRSGIDAHQKYISGEGQKEFESSGLSKDKHYLQFLEKNHLAWLNLPEDAITALVAPEAQRQAGNIKDVESIAYGLGSMTDSNVVFSETLEAAKPELKTNPNIYSEIVQGKYDEIYAHLKTTLPDINTDTEEGRAYLHNKTQKRLTGLLYAQAFHLQLDEDEIKALKEGKITKIASGDKGELLLSDLDWDTISRGRTDGINFELKRNEAALIAEANTTLATYLKDPENFDGDLSLIARSLVSRGMKEDNPIIKTLNTINIEDQDKESYISQSKLYTSEFKTLNRANRQSLLDNSITNQPLWKELNTIHEKLNEFEDKAGLKNGSYEAKSINWVKENNKASLASGVALDPDSQSQMAGEIERLFYGIHNDFILKAPEGQTPKETFLLAESRLKEVLDSKGFSEKDENSPNAGIYTRTNEGKYPGLTSQFESKKEFNTGSDHQTTYDDINKALKHENINNVNDVVNSGKAISNDELIALKRFGFNETTGKFERYPPDILIKAQVLGVQPSVLVKKKIAALKGSNDAKDKLLVNIYGLDDKFAKLIPNTDLEVRKFIEQNSVSIMDSDNLLYAYERIGIQNFSPNMLNKLMDLEQKLDPKGYKRQMKKEAENQLKILKDRRDEIIKEQNAKKQFEESDDQWKIDENQIVDPITPSQTNIG